MVGFFDNFNEIINHSYLMASALAALSGIYEE